MPPDKTQSVGPVPVGLHHFMTLEGDSPTRFHLRVDPDGAGLLLANAAEAAHLSPVGVLMVQGVLSEQDDEAIRAEVRAHFSGGSEAQMTEDLAQVRKMIADLASPADNYPITSFGGWSETPDARRLGAPFRADVTHGDPASLEAVLRALWEASIPHVVFLADPARDPAELVRLVECAGDMGMITGIRGLASWLPDDILHAAALAGLDALAVLFASCDAELHDELVGAPDHLATVAAFKACREVELCPIAKVPLVDANVDELEDMVAQLVEQDVRSLSVFGVACPDDDARAQAAGALTAKMLPQVATMITECADQAGVRFIWEPPVRFDGRRSLADNVVMGPRASGDVSIRVEPDGSVYPARGPRACAGNVVSQEWSEVWGNECFQRYREVVEAPSRCDVCPGLDICAPACPRDLAGWSDDTQEGDPQ